MSTGDLVPSKVPCPYNLKTNESKHWQSLCDTCNISYACMTWHAILQHAYDAFNGQNSLVMGLSTLIERYVTSMTAHHTPRSSNRIGRDRNSSFGFKSCRKHVTSHSSVQKASIHLQVSFYLPEIDNHWVAIKYHPSYQLVQGLCLYVTGSAGPFIYQIHCHNYRAIVIGPAPQVLPMPFWVTTR